MADENEFTAEELALIEGQKAVAPPAPEPEPVAAATDDTEDSGAEVVADAADGEAEKKPQKAVQTVPHQALHEERRLRQESDKRAEEANKRAQVLEERMNILLRGLPQQQQQPQPEPKEPAPNIPEIDKDPVGHILGTLRHEFGRRDQILVELANAVSGQTRQSEESRALQQLAVQATAMEREFAARQPDYQQAYEHLVESRRLELAAQGNAPDRIAAMLSQEAALLAHNALQNNRNPGELVYELAKIRGYKPTDSKPDAKQPEAANGAAAATQAAVEQIQQIAAGQQQASGLNRAAGGAAPAIDAAAVANMPIEEFMEWAKKTSPTKQRAIIGGVVQPR